MSGPSPYQHYFAHLWDPTLPARTRTFSFNGLHQLVQRLTVCFGNWGEGGGMLKNDTLANSVLLSC
jgi:hypothetical protein